MDVIFTAFRILQLGLGNHQNPYNFDLGKDRTFLPVRVIEIFLKAWLSISAVLNGLCWLMAGCSVG